MIMTMDIGGTKTLWALWEAGQLVEKDQMPTCALGDPVRFLAGLSKNRQIDCLCIAGAGPVTESEMILTNAGLHLDLQKLKASLPQVREIAMLNDLEAAGHCLPVLRPEQIIPFRKGEPQRGAKAIISLGTGLGICGVTRRGEVIPSEGGHVDFAPRGKTQQNLALFLREKYGHVSYERVLSGQGISDIYQYLTGCQSIAPKQVAQKASEEEAAALESMYLFSAVLGSACSSYALMFLATGGLFLGGGIAPKISSLLNKVAFEIGWLDKGRSQDLLEQIPVSIITDEMAPSIGAAVYGARLQRSSATAF